MKLHFGSFYLTSFRREWSHETNNGNYSITGDCRHYYTDQCLHGSLPGGKFICLFSGVYSVP